MIEKTPQAKKAQGVKQLPSSQMFLCTQKLPKAQKATFSILDVSMLTKIPKSTRCKALLLLRRFMRTKMLFFFICLCVFCAFYAFLPHRCFYARLRLFLFLFAYERFVLFVLVVSFCERYKTSPITSFTKLQFCNMVQQNIFILTKFLQLHLCYIVASLLYCFHSLFSTNILIGAFHIPNLVVIFHFQYSR